MNETNISARRRDFLAAGLVSASAIAALSPNSAAAAGTCPICSVKDFGAVGDGIADDTSAMQAFLNHIATQNVAGYIPGGDYKLSLKISTAGNVNLRGDGRNKARLIWPANAVTSGIEISTQPIGSFDSQVHIHGIGLFTSGAATGTALKIIGSTMAAADRITPRISLSDIHARGLNHPTADGWNTAIHLDGCQLATLRDIYINGKVGAAGEPNYDSTYGVLYNNSVGLSPHPGAIAIYNVYIGYCKTAIHLYDFEGAIVDGCNVNGNVGIYAGGPENYPGVYINGCHANCSDTCIFIDRMAEAIITNNILYKELGSNTGRGVWLKNGATFCQVRGNNFTNTGSTSHQMYGVLVEASDDNTVEGNTFRAVNTPGGGGVAIWFASGSRNQLGINKFGPTVDAPFVDTATATIRADGKSSCGVYTPSLVAVANIASITGFSSIWMRVGDVMTVSGQVNVTPAAIGGTQFEIPLPIQSTFTLQEEVCGVGASFTPSQSAARIYGNPTNRTAIFRFQAATTAVTGFSYTFSYRIK